jgi:hypothetical protein
MSPRFNMALNIPLLALSIRCPPADSLRGWATVMTWHALRAFSAVLCFSANSMIFPVLVALITR